MLDVDLSIRDLDGRAVVALRGELNLADTPGVASHLIAAVAACGVQAVAPGQPDRRTQPGERHDNERGRHSSTYPALDGARRLAAVRERRRPVIVSHRKLRRHRGCSAWSHSGSRSW
ncbi:MAG: hypothetical protein ACLP8X_39270 [Streptosporangiaceae bacterium]